MVTFTYGSGQKNIPFRSPLARIAKQKTHLKDVLYGASIIFLFYSMMPIYSVNFRHLNFLIMT